MKIVLLLLVLVAAFGFAMKKTFDSRVLLAERIKTERSLAWAEQTAPEPRTVILL
ncbi:hypothetical protein [Pontibacter roseus]|uniref:hypothetical protein n=1 Tax=Pontibacter roseus TaxID=336989 RepID=UPI00036B38CF|nr:hypothetical protein [Pontibacter roseus]